MGARGPVLTVAGLGVVAAAAALGLVLGAGPNGGAAAAPSAEATTAPSAGLAGRWSGPLLERGGPTVDVWLSVTATRAASLDVPALGCRYTGTVPDPAADAVVATLQTTDDPQGLCADRATVRLTPLSQRSLRYELLRTCDRGAPCTRRDAAALLTAH